MKMESRIPDPKQVEQSLRLLASVFNDMSRNYTEIADQYGFTCSGCEDNCCLTRFHHHTLFEYLFLQKGLFALSDDKRAELVRQAEEVCRRIESLEITGSLVRVMCPLNENGLCTLYEFRPMICRLHGIPHELRKPGGPVVYGPGCGEFDARFGNQEYRPFDRTPFYFKMAGLEGELRGATGYDGKIKMTVAEMILDICI